MAYTNPYGSVYNPQAQYNPGQTYRQTGGAQVPTGVGKQPQNVYTTQPVQPNAAAGANTNASAGGGQTPGGGGDTGQNWWDTWSGQNNTPTYPSTQTGQQTANNQPGTQVGVANPNSFSWTPPSWVLGLDQAGWADPQLGQALANYQNLLPYVQAQQNAMQYGMDFNENQRRWDEQFGWTQTTDQFNMGLAGQQQQLADWVAKMQQQNWGQQFGLDSELGRGYLQNQNQQTQIDQMYKQGLLTNEQYANETQRIQAANQLHLGNAQNQIAQFNADTQRNEVQNQYALGNRELDVKDWYQRQSVGVAQAQTQIDQAYKQGLITNEQRQLALAELTQQQNQAYQYAQLSQQAQLQREQMAAQQQMANIAAFGRVQTPNARFARAW